jgi:Na+/H+ antiporter NhaD/arsenite permease-like protein
MPTPAITAPVFNRWQSVKGLVVVALIVGAFVLSDWPREVVALAGAGLLMVSGELASREMLGLVDWHLLVLFAGLFIVNEAVQQAGLLDAAILAVRSLHLDPADPATLFGVTVVLSNLVSNVPAVMLLLPMASHPLAGAILALASTLAGNLLIVGSIANIIVVENARRAGITIDWRTHARVGLPVGLLSLAVAAGFLVG